ncbi:MAG TPA: hypothetical protein VJ808_12430, partial [Gemmatimonadales bacterium]|nr:hypothetical protein [Gemmatimonadales bacterium]
MNGIEIRGPRVPDADRIVTPEAITFLHRLSRKFGPRRKELLQQRVEVQRQIRAGARPDFQPRTREIREGSWKVAAAPSDLNDRRVEITGPVERKMMRQEDDSHPAFAQNAKNFV